MTASAPLCATCGEALWPTVSTGPAGITPVFHSCPTCDGPFTLRSPLPILAVPRPVPQAPVVHGEFDRVPDVFAHVRPPLF